MESQSVHSEGKDVLDLDCKGCGTSFPEGTKFCSVCGEAFPESESKGGAPAAQSAEPEAAGSSSPSPVLLIGLAVIAAVVLYVMFK